MIPIDLLTTQSHQAPFLQIADLVIEITVAMILGKDKYAMQYFPIIKDTFYKGTDGKIDGYGLKLFPEVLKDRYCILEIDN